MPSEAVRRHLLAPEGAPGPALPRETLVDRARQAVLDLIDEEGLAVGDPLPPVGVLAERFAVSRAVVREALSALGALGIVEIANGRPARVRAPDPTLVRVFLARALRETPGDGVAALMDLRSPLEVRAAALAARAPLSEREELAALLARMGDALDDDELYPRLDLELHAAIARIGRNRALRGVLEAVRVPLFRAMRELRPAREARGLLGQEHAEHERIVAAVLAGDPEQAASAMTAHMASVESLTRARRPEEAGPVP